MKIDVKFTKVVMYMSLLLCLTMLLTVCTDPTPPETKPPPLRVEWTYWPGFYPMAIAIELGLFAKHGVEVKPLLYDSAAKAVSDFSAKMLDGVMLPTSDILPLATRIPLKVVLIIDISAGADNVVARADIKSVRDLEGKRIGYSPGDFSELFILKMLKQNGLTRQDVTLMAIDSEDVLEALEQNLIAAGNTWEPYTSAAVRGGNRVIFSSTETPGLIMDAATFHASVVAARPNDILAFNTAWFEAVEFWENNPAEAAQMIAKHTDLKPEEVSSEGLKIFSVADNKAAFLRNQELTSVYSSAHAYIDLFVATGQLSVIPDLEELFDSSFIESLDTAEIGEKL